MRNENEFKKELELLINRYSIDSQLNTPDFIITQYLFESLRAIEGFNLNREGWFGLQENIEIKAIEKFPKKG